jgi:hypothetical protein
VRIRLKCGHAPSETDGGTTEGSAVADRIMTTAPPASVVSAVSTVPAVPGAAAAAAFEHRRPATPARREVVRAFRDQVASGTYEPPVDAVSAALAAWLLCDGLPDLES